MEPTNGKPLHDRLRDARTGAGLLQRQAALAFGVDRTTLGDWEMGAYAIPSSLEPIIVRWVAAVLAGGVPDPAAFFSRWQAAAKEADAAAIADRAAPLAERLVAARRQRGVRQRDVAKLFGVVQATYWRWEQGTQEIPAAYLPLLERWVRRGKAPGRERLDRAARESLRRPERKRRRALGQSRPAPPRNAPLRVRLIYWRRLRGILQYEVAKMLGIARNRYRRWELGVIVHESAVDGEAIPESWVPVLARWIETGVPPTAEAIEQARGGDPRLTMIRERERVLRERAIPRHGVPADPTFAEVLDIYTALHLVKLAPITRRNQLQKFEVFRRDFGTRRVSECRAIDFTCWLESHADTWKSDWTPWGHKQVVNACLNWAVREEIIPRNPFWAVRYRQGKRLRNLTDVEMQTALRFTKPPCGRWHEKPSPPARFRQFLIFMWRTGARPSEIVKLRWEHVDWAQRVVVLHDHKTVRQQKNPQPRAIALDRVLINLLHWIRRHDPSPDFVFRNSTGRPWARGTLTNRFWQLRRRAGLPRDAKLYGMRHAFGTRVVKRTGDIKVASTLLGHTTSRMAEHYVHLESDYDHLVSTIDLVNRRPSKKSAGVRSLVQVS
jgi:integrase/DNA-binding XRE family transcriptional regulator